MNRAAYETAQFFKPREAVLLQRSLFFAIGNQYFPLVRRSAGIYAINEMAKAFNLTWKDCPRGSIEYSAAAYPGGVVFAKPRRHREVDQTQAVSDAVSEYDIPLSGLTLVHHDKALPVGRYEITHRPSETETEEILAIHEVLGRDDLRHIRVGSGPLKGEEEFQLLPTSQMGGHSEDLALQYYLDNRWTREQERQLSYMVPQLVAGLRDEASH
eukprot:TRINITY_DN12936_c0_g1_i1.p1 TRINITY_DN12936_c0_g1~~TRINITY_DN12936_c0_g1_i1.p1  ORF type:complete len:213 (-),score=66.91 TRINITY_DN12936_c0_g1_i1:434-1072(-)